MSKYLVIILFLVCSCMDKNKNSHSDVQKFYAAPSPAQILECLSLPQDKACLLGKRTDGTTFLLMTIKEGGVWKMESMIEDWEKVVSWLPGKLLNADTKDYKMFTLYAMTYFLFYRDGETIYWDLTGKEYTPDKACEELVNEVNRMNLYQEKIEEMKSKTDTDLKL